MNFKVGDVAVIQNADNPANNGNEVVVASGLKMITAKHGLTGEVTTELRYILHDGTACKPYQLRPKGYDGNQVIGWENSVWQPKQVQA